MDASRNFTRGDINHFSVRRRRKRTFLRLSRRCRLLRVFIASAQGEREFLYGISQERSMTSPFWNSRGSKCPHCPPPYGRPCQGAVCVLCIDEEMHYSTLVPIRGKDNVLQWLRHANNFHIIVRWRSTGNNNNNNKLSCGTSCARLPRSRGLFRGFSGI